MFLRNVRKRLTNLLVIHNVGDLRDLELDYGFVQGHLFHLFLDLHGLNLTVWDAPFLKVGLGTFVLLNAFIRSEKIVMVV